MNPAALITGSSRGIGRGIAVEIARLGYDLLLHYAQNETAAAESEKLCRAAAESHGKQIHVKRFRGDIADGSVRANLIKFARDQFPALHLLVNNAGMAPLQRLDLLETTEESFDRLLAVNVKGPFFLSQLAARWMLNQPAATSSEAGGLFRPKIIMISSVSAYAASVNRGEYCISKAALSMVTALYASRLAEHGIRVFEIRPGIISTDMTAGVKGKYDSLIGAGLTPIARWGTPEDVGKAVAALARDDFPFSTGDVFNVDGGFHLRRL